MRLWKKILFFVLLFSGFAAFAFWAIYAIAGLRGASVWIAIPVGLFGFAVTLYLGVALHELGHLVFGLACGMEFYSLELPFLKIYKSGGRIRTSFIKFSAVLGSCEMLPTQRVSPKKAFAVEALGGPVGSLIGLGVSVVFLALAPYISPYLTIFFGPAAPILYVIFIENAFPMSANGVRTDGGQIAELLSDTPSARVLLSSLTAQAMLKSGKRASEIPYEVLFEVPQLPEDDANYVLILSLRYLYAIDRADLDLIKDLNVRLKDILPSLPTVYYESVLCDVFFDSLFISPDVEFVQKNAERALKVLNRESDVASCRIRAYYCLYNGDLTGALKEINAGRELAPYYPFPGVAETELRLLAEAECTVGAELAKTV